jgi:hypothetical protein
MQQTPDDLPDLIRRTALMEAERQHKTIFPAALDRLATPPRTFSLNEIGEVDVRRLHRMLHDIINLTPSAIGPREIQAALRKVKCHYLWFC